MPYIRTLLSTFLLALLLVACGQADGPDATDVRPAEDPAFAADMHVVDVEATASGYEPEHIELHEGVPTRLVLTRTTDAACVEEVEIPDFGVERTELPRDESVEIEFTPDRTGEFTFVCGMDMVNGTLVVES